MKGLYILLLLFSGKATAQDDSESTPETNISPRSSLTEYELDLIPFTYSYPKGDPKGCCDGFYDDPSLDILNSDDGFNPEAFITQSNSIEWNKNDHDYEPLLDLNVSHIVKLVKVSYIVAPSWGKYAPKDLLIEGSLGKNNDSSHMEYAANISNGFPTSTGGHTVTVSTVAWNAVQYIKLTDVTPSKGNSIVSNIAVYGYSCDLDIHQFASLAREASMKPLFGPEVGGTIVQIGNGSPEEYPLQYDVDIFCRFNSTSFSRIFPGVFVRLDNTVECVSPFSGQSINATVSYAIIPRYCSIDEATWIDVNEEFEYAGDRAGLIVNDADNDNGGDDDHDQDNGDRTDDAPDCNFTCPQEIPDNFAQCNATEIGSCRYSCTYDDPYCFFECDDDYNNNGTGVWVQYCYRIGVPLPTVMPISVGSNEGGPSGIPLPMVSPTSVGSGVGGPSRIPLPTALQTVSPTSVGISLGASNTGSRIFFIGNEIQVEWSSTALALSAFRNSRSTFYGDSSDDYGMNVGVEILAFNNTAESSLSPFQKIYSVSELPFDTNSTTLVLDNDIISPSMIVKTSGGTGVAIILIRVVVYTDQFRSADEISDHWILATRTSKLIGVFQNNTDMDDGGCPIVFNEDCRNNGDLDPCPPSHDVSLNDINFSPDETCMWPSGRSPCDPKIDLDVDLAMACLNAEETGDSLSMSNCPEDFTEFDADAVDESDGCRCGIFHTGAIGCVTNGLSQCCYSESGALITEYEDGAGRPTCDPIDGTSFEPVDNFLFDVLPYLYCCRLNDNCESYYSGFPSNDITDGYITPPTAAVSFGDPHIVTFDSVKYDFNGFGEYIAACGGPMDLTPDQLNQLCDPLAERRLTERRIEVNEYISIHYRFRSLVDGQNGTVLIGVAIEDSMHFGGTRRLIIMQGGESRRLDVYDNSEPVHFPTTSSKRKRRVSRILSTTTISIPRDRNQDSFAMVIKFKSGLRIRITETLGVMNPSIRRPSGYNNFVGLMGQGNGTKTFVAPGGNVTIITKNDPTRTFTSEETEQIFDEFGQKWMITDDRSSLFQHILNPNFNTLFKADFRPIFGISTDSRRLENPFDPTEGLDPTEVCGGIEDDFIQEACFYDLFITNNTDLVMATSDVAVLEQTIAAVLRNTPPEILDDGRNKEAEVDIGDTITFNINTRDADGDNITASIEDNDDSNLFQLSSQGSGVFNLFFLGSDTAGRFRVHITVTDNIIPVIITRTVFVTLTAAHSTIPSSIPSAEPSPIRLGKRSKQKSAKESGQKIKRIINN